MTDIKARNEQHLAPLHPTLVAMVRRLLADCETVGCPTMVAQGHRSAVTQQALWMQGRYYPLDVVNQARSKALLAPITAVENKRIVTKSKPGYSFHEYDLAVDLAYAVGDLYKELDHPLTWSQIGALGEAHGLTWGGRFHEPDRPHFQWSGGLALSQLRAGQRPPVVA